MVPKVPKSLAEWICEMLSKAESREAQEAGASRDQPRDTNDGCGQPFAAIDIERRTNDGQ